jgi:hypothetical protein
MKVKRDAGAAHDEAAELLAALKPGVPLTWTARYRIGVAMNRQMDHLCTLDEVAAELGITKQNAYTETVLALGTLVCLLHARLLGPRPGAHLYTSTRLAVKIGAVLDGKPPSPLRRKM